MRHTEFFRNGDGGGNDQNDRLNISMTLPQSQMRMTLNQTALKSNTIIGVGGRSTMPERNTFTVQELLSFVNQNFFIDSPLQLKQLQNPTQKHFSIIFWGLLKMIDPNIKMDSIPIEDIPSLMKFWNYPYQLNKNMFITLGAPHTWQHVQTLLLWLFQLTKSIKQLADISPDSQKSIFQNNQTQIHKNDMDILNQFIAKSFKKRENQLNLGGSSNNYHKLNSTNKNPPLTSSGMLNQQNNSFDEEKEAKDIGEQLKLKNSQLLEIIKEYEMKIDTIKLANKNLCIKQPELQEVNNRIEQQQDLINMEQQIIYQLNNENEDDTKEINNLENIFQNKMIEIHELTLEKKKINQQIQDQEYNINEAEKKMKDIERLKNEKDNIEVQINQYSQQRQTLYNQIEGQINDMNLCQNDYNKVLNISSDVFLQCQDIQVALNYDRLRADSFQNLTNGIQMNQEDIKFGDEQYIMNSKILSKEIVKSMINIDVKKAAEKLNKLNSEYSISAKSQEESIKQIKREIEEKKTQINDLDIKINQIHIKTQQKQEELKQLINSIQDRQVNFKQKSEECLQTNANLNFQINQMKEQEFNLENELSVYLTQIEDKKTEFLKEKNEAQLLLDNQHVKINQAKEQILEKFGQICSYYENLTHKNNKNTTNQQFFHKQQ